MITMWRNNLRSHTAITDPNSVQGAGSLEVSDQFVKSIISLVQKTAGNTELQPHLAEFGQLIEESLHIRTTGSENIFQMLVREFPLGQMPLVFIQRLQKLGERQIRDMDRQITYLNQTSDDLDQRPSLLSLQQHTMIAVIRLALNDVATSQEKFDSLIEKYMDVYLEVKKCDNPDVKFSEIADEGISDIEIYLEGSEQERFSSYAL